MATSKVRYVSNKINRVSGLLVPYHYSDLYCPLGLGIKRCSFKASGPISASKPLSNIEAAKREVFLKTLGLFGALKRRGCGYKTDALPSEAYDPLDDSTDSGSDVLSEPDDDEDDDSEDYPGDGDADYGIRRDPRSPVKPSCSGRIVMEKTHNGTHVVR